jgi:hypothetical protein
MPYPVGEGLTPNVVALATVLQRASFIVHVRTPIGESDLGDIGHNGPLRYALAKYLDEQGVTVGGAPPQEG